MSVTLRGSKFHYRFRIAGNDYSGACPDCDIPVGATPREISASKKKALQIEQDARNRVTQNLHKLQETEKEIRQNKTVRALVENYKYELTGGSPIRLADAFTLAAAKPARRPAAPRFAEQRRVYWNDFVAFMAESHPDLDLIASVLRSHCESYVTYLVEHGRFIKTVQYQMQGKRKVRQVAYARDYGISPKTIKEIVGVCKWVFNKLAEDAGLLHDPWSGIQLPESAPVDREIFSTAELRSIWEGIQTNEFCFPLFMIAANSGLTEGDICTLKWCEIDWTTGYLRRTRRKTGANIKLPLLPQLAEYLRTLPRRGEYLLPEHAELYLRQPSCVSERVKSFLSGLGIVTTVEVPGRRAVSVKDLHSMRHVFCYRAKRAGIPESIIAKFVGHKVIAMTQHYADHDTDEELSLEIKKLPALFLGEPGVSEDATSRQRLAELAYSLPLESVEQLLRSLSPPPGAALRAL